MIRPVNGSGMKRMALLNDLSCFGKCSLSVAMPILSSYGVETVPLPTAILSTQRLRRLRHAGHDGRDEGLCRTLEET